MDKLLEHYEKEQKSNDEETVSQVTNLNLKDVSNAEVESSKDNSVHEQTNVNITDEEKERLATTPTNATPAAIDHPFLETIYEALECTENDYAALFALSLLFALSNNSGEFTLLFCPDRHRQF